MVAPAPHILPDGSLPEPAPDADRRRAWFALALPAVMALLLTLVPLMGKAAFGPMVLTLVPLVLWAAFRDTERALYVYIAWCWMDGTIRGLVDQNALAIVARDLVLGAVLVGWGLQRLQSRAQNPVRVPPGSLLVFLFVINCLLQVANPYSLGLIQSIGGLKLHLSAIPLLFMGYDVFRRREQLRALFVFLTLATLVAGLVSAVQYFGGQDWTWAHFPGTKEVISQTMRSMVKGQNISDIASFKPPGTTGFGGGTSAFPAFVFPLTFALPLLGDKLRFSPRAKICFYAVIMAFVVIILINSVRAALVIGVCSAAVMILLMGSRLRARLRTSLIACAVLALGAWTISQSVSQGGVTNRYASTLSNPVSALHEDRQTFFDQIGDILRQSPMGVGLGRAGASGGRLGNNADKDTLGFTPFSEAYLGTMIFETGVLGAALITSVLIVFAVQGYRAMIRLQEPDDRLLLASLLSVFAVIFANFFAYPVLLAPPGSVLFWLLGGAMLRVFAAPAFRRKAPLLAL